MPFVEDLSAFFSTSAFATTATLDGASVAGIFDNAYMDALGLATTEPRFTLRSTDATTTTTASLLVVNGATYRVRSVQPDGTGVTVLALERQ